MLANSLQSHARVAFIGTRLFDSLPDAIRGLFLQAAEVLAIRQMILVTGAAIGADQAAADAALAVGGCVHLVLPWASYEHKWVDRARARYHHRVTVGFYDPARHSAWAESVRTYHPAPARLSPGAFALHARNFGIVIEAGAVIAAAADPNGGGGTGQGLRIARALGRDVVDLWKADDQVALASALDQ